MRYLTKEEESLLYRIIETAVETKSPVDFPAEFYTELSLLIGKNGFAFIIPGLYWGEGENRYEALMKMDIKDNNLKISHLYVNGNRRNDGRIGDEVWMFKDVYRRQTATSSALIFR